MACPKPPTALSLAVDRIATNVVIHGYQDAGRSGDLTVWAKRPPTA